MSYTSNRNLSLCAGVPFVTFTNVAIRLYILVVPLWFESHREKNRSAKKD